MIPTHHPKISIAKIADNDFEILYLRISKILDSLYDLSESEVKEEMKEIVPGYTTKLELVEK
jgi:hypothetical protein